MKSKCLLDIANGVLSIESEVVSAMVDIIFRYNFLVNYVHRQKFQKWMRL
jgi:hypothetical protein